MIGVTAALGLGGFVGRVVAVALGVGLGGVGGFALMKLARVEELRVVDGWIARLRGRAR